MRVFSRKQSRPMLAILSKERLYWKDLGGPPRSLQQNGRESCLKARLQESQINQGHLTGAVALHHHTCKKDLGLQSSLCLCFHSVRIQSPGSKCLIGWAYHGTTRKWVEEEPGPLNFCSCWERERGGNPGNLPLTKTSYNVEFAQKGDPDRYWRGKVECCLMDWKKKSSPKCSSQYCVSYLMWGEA